MSGLIELDDASFGHKFKGDRGSRTGATEKRVRVMVSTTGEGKLKFAKMAVADFPGCFMLRRWRESRWNRTR